MIKTQSRFNYGKQFFLIKAPDLVFNLEQKILLQVLKIFFWKTAYFTWCVRIEKYLVNRQLVNKFGIKCTVRRSDANDVLYIMRAK